MTVTERRYLALETSSTATFSYNSEFLGYQQLNIVHHFRQYFQKHIKPVYAVLWVSLCCTLYLPGSCIYNLSFYLGKLNKKLILEKS